MHVLPGSRQDVFAEGNFWVENHAHDIFPFFLAAIAEDGGRTVGGGRSYRAHIGASPISLVHCTLSFGPRLLLLFDLHNRFPWPLPSLFCHSFLWCMTTLLPHRFSFAFNPQQLFLHAKIVLDVHTILLLLLSLCLEPAAIVFLHFSK